MKSAGEPFRFVTASHLTRICNEKATRLADLLSGIEASSDASIFYHTFQSLRRHHFLTRGFSNDFAQWVLASTNQAALAEQLAALDVRDYLSLADLRGDLWRVLAEYCKAHPDRAQQLAFEPFFFCETVEVTVPLGLEARTLQEFREGLEGLSSASFYFHFITSRLRLQLRTNDFGQWFENELGLEALARLSNRIDIYTNTLDEARASLIGLIDEELRK